MIMLHEHSLVKVVEVPHSVPKPIKVVMMVSHASRVRLERDIGRATYCLNGMEITPIGIGFVCGYLVNVECLGSLSYQSRKLEGISRLMGGYLNTGNNMGFDTAHKVSLNPILMAALLAPACGQTI